MTVGRVKLLDKAPVWPKGLEPLPARDVFEFVCKHVGARPKDRDPVGRRIIEEMRAGKGGIIDSQNDVGGYPKVKMTVRKLEIPKQNVDAWLKKLASLAIPSTGR